MDLYQILTLFLVLSFAKGDPILDVAIQSLIPSLIISPMDNNPLHDNLSFIPISKECRTAMIQYRVALQERQTWALRMWDSSGKYPVAGAREGNFFALGSYDQCLIHMTSAQSTYCSIGIASHNLVFDPLHGYTPTIMKGFKSLAPFFKGMPGTVFRIGWCVPTDCSPVDVELVIDSILKLMVHNDLMQNAFANSIGTVSQNNVLAIDQVVCTGTEGIPFDKSIIQSAESYSFNKDKFITTKIKEINLHFYASTCFLGIIFAIVIYAHFTCERINTTRSKTTLGYRLLECFSLGTNIKKLFYGTEENNNRRFISATSNGYSNGKHAQSNGINSYENVIEYKPLSVLNGIRAVSMIHVILAHTYILSMFVIRNIAEVLGPTMFQDPFIVFLFSGFFAVDTFFFLSGFLCVMNTVPLKAEANGHLINGNGHHDSMQNSGFKRPASPDIKVKASGNFKESLKNVHVNGSIIKHENKLVLRGTKIKGIAATYLYRYVRLTPLYVALLISETYILPHIFGRSGGPLKGISDGNEVNCKAMWWTNLLYINNLVGERRMCGIWTWYLANDVQFHLLVPFLLTPWALGTKGIRIRQFILTVILNVSVCYSFAVSLKRGYSPGLLPNDAKVLDTFHDYYINPIVRISPFILGMLLGCMLQHLKSPSQLGGVCLNEEQIKARPKFSYFLMTAASPIISILVYLSILNLTSTSTIDFGAILASLINSMGRVFWSCLIACLIYNAFVWRQATPLTHFLSHKAWLPISNVTYAAYLIHPLAIQTVIRNLRQPLYLTHTLFVVLAAGYWIISYGVGLVFSLTFEVPAINFAKAFIKPSGVDKNEATAARKTK